MGEDLRDIGEFGLIRRLLARLPFNDALVVGPGDDAAVIEQRDGRALLATADLLVEGRHFDLAFSDPEAVGYKAIAVNASDIAAMGGQPTAALISLGCPEASSVASLELLYDGIGEAAMAFGVAIAGGDVVASDELLISVAMLGEAERPVLRSGARPGDLLCVTGTLGSAAAGLWLMRANSDAEARELLERFQNLSEAHRRGGARVREGMAAASAGATAMIDVSDGFAQDVGHILEQSGCGAVLDGDPLPLGSGVPEVAAWLGEAPESIGLHGGDDYELVIAIPSDAIAALRKALAPTLLTVVGHITDGDRLTRAGGSEVEMKGWDHFS